jgi:hypothetical protein
MISRKCFKAAKISPREQGEINSKIQGMVDMGMDEKKAALKVVSDLSKEAKTEKKQIKAFIKENQPKVAKKELEVEKPKPPDKIEAKKPIEKPEPVEKIEKKETKPVAEREEKPKVEPKKAKEFTPRTVEERKQIEKADDKILSYKILKDCAI